MRKFTLLTAVFALFATAASADTKVIYQDNYSDKTTSLANWQDNRSNAAIDFVGTPDGNYMQFNLALNGANFNGTRFYSIWGATPWEGVTLPETGYKFEVSFNFEQFGNNANSQKDGAYNQRNHEIAIIGAANEDNIATYWGDAATSYPNYLFKLTQCQTGDAAGEGGWPTAVNGTCGFYINNETDLITVAAATWYKLTLEVVGQTVKYDISDISGTPLKSGSYTLPDGADNRAGGMLVYGARYASKTNVGLSLKITCESDEAVANEPVVALSQVKGNDRVYKVTFAEGELLHYILPNGDEQTIDYWDAEDEAGNPGVAMLTATQSGTMQVWTSKNEAVSSKVNVEVTAGWIKLVDPVVVISNVSEGFGKSFNVTFNSAAPEHLLPVNAAITYTIDGGAEQEVANGGTITMDKAGTLVVTVNQIPQGGQEYYQRSSVTINNDVEYTVAMTTEYIKWDDTHFAGNAAWEAGTLEDSNLSHWLGHFMESNKYDKEEQDKMKEDPSYVPVPTQNPVKNYKTDQTDIALPIYTLVNDEAGVNYANELLPLIPNTARANIAILLEEGIFVNGTSYNNLELTFDPKWVTDDAAKPNFIEIRKTNSYDRYDKGPGRHTTDIVKTDVTTYTLYRFDTAIHSARVFTYKGFNPGTGIEAITTVKEANQNAPIYTIGGVQVKDASQKGIYIQNGKKFVVK